MHMSELPCNQDLKKELTCFIIYKYVFSLNTDFSINTFSAFSFSHKRDSLIQLNKN